MSNLFVKNGTEYELIATGDGSPSIRMQYMQPNTDVGGHSLISHSPANINKIAFSNNGPLLPEAMHNRNGALSETLYIYGELLEKMLLKSCYAHIFSLGLGCGYNEIMSAATILKKDIDPNDFYLESYEADALIRQNFINWMKNDSSLQTEPSILEKIRDSGIIPAASVQSISEAVFTEQLQQLFTQVLNLMAKNYDLEPVRLKAFLKKLHDEEKLVVKNALTQKFFVRQRFAIIYFDAFSSKMSPELWTEDFLDYFIATVCAPTCGFATYACTGALRRTLSKAGFAVEKRPGFMGKRESTVAFRG